MAHQSSKLEMDLLSLCAENHGRLSADDYERMVDLLESGQRELRFRGYLALSPTHVASRQSQLLRSELGSATPSIIDVLGVREAVVEFVTSRLVPHCSACGCQASPPIGVTANKHPQSGVLAVSIVGADERYAIKERMELLGLERAYVQGRIVSGADITQDEGEPVLCVAAADDLQPLQAAVEHWFARGGGELRMLHLVSRGAVANELTRLRNTWSCAGCGAQFPRDIRTALREAPACLTCRGQGWISVRVGVDGERFQACRGCNGLGFTTDGVEYYFYNRVLSQVLAMSCAEVLNDVAKLGQGHVLQRYLGEICSAGLGNAPLGMAYHLCSPGERLAISLAQLRLARIEGATFLIDRAYGDLAFGDSAVVSVQPVIESAPQVSFGVPANSKQIVLRDVHHGVLQIDEVTFPRAAVSTINGPVGSGKSLLLKIIERRFAKRRQSQHNASFGDLRYCWAEEALSERRGVLLNALGLASDFAKEVSGTRRARELGILQKDIELPNGKYVCEACCGGGHEYSAESCPVCQGARFDWRVAELPFMGRTVGEIMRAPLAELIELPWSAQALPDLCGDLVRFMAPCVSLGSALSACSSSWRRLLSVVGLLGRVKSSASTSRRGVAGGAHASHLVLLDGPCVMPRQHQEIIGGLLESLVSNGATVIYASMPEGLESCCQSVLRLGWPANATSESSALGTFLDQRFSRRSVVLR